MGSEPNFVREEAQEVVPKPIFLNHSTGRKLQRPFASCLQGVSAVISFGWEHKDQNTGSNDAKGAAKSGRETKSPTSVLGRPQPARPDFLRSTRLSSTCGSGGAQPSWLQDLEREWLQPGPFRGGGRLPHIPFAFLIPISASPIIPRNR